MTSRERQRVLVGVAWGLACHLVTAVPSPAAPLVRHVDGTDRTCGLRTPCYASIQAAVNAAGAGDVVRIHAGVYREQVSVHDKNDSARAGEDDRIVIEADPAAPVGSVVLEGAVSQCTNGHAVRFRRSRFVTLRGLTITGAGGSAVSLLGGNNDNEGIHLERLRITGNGSPECDGGITIARGNRRTLLLNSLIHGNGRNGLAMLDAQGGPHVLIGNTIHGNGWNGVSIGRDHEVALVNNLVTGNGRAPGKTGGRFGVSREPSNRPDPPETLVLHNMICGNRLGEIDGIALDPRDSGNLTPSGTEGPGVAASPGCGMPATVYAALAGADGRLDTVDDDFTLASGSPALDQGLDPRPLGLPPSLAPRLEADYALEGARPRDATGTAAPHFDIGALERSSSDARAPSVAFLQPSPGAFVRQSIAVQAQASDDAKVASFGLSVDGQGLEATVVPAPPAPSVTGTGMLRTQTLPDGSHTLRAVARDLAGNDASATRVIIVDNTPPRTQITTGPSGPAAGTTATFAYSGTDNLSGADGLVFAWRLDGGPYTAFSPVQTATLAGLSPGPHTFEVKARDRAGNEDPTPASRAFTLGPALGITIRDPIDGATVPSGLVLVRGVVDLVGMDVGVVVNGAPALTQAGVFAALVPVGPSTTSILATATTGDGSAASQEIRVAVAEIASAGMRATPASGPPPLSVAFLVTGAGPGSPIEVDADGDGRADVAGHAPDAPSFVYTQPGLYFPSATFVDPHGTSRTARGLVQVHDLAGLDAILQARWTALKDALRRGDVPRALASIALRARPRYESMLDDLRADLHDIDSILTSFHLVEVRRSEAIGEMLRDNGSFVESFEIRFSIDDDGVWRVAAL
jgi:hypothetical protein